MTITYPQMERKCQAKYLLCCTQVNVQRVLPNDVVLMKASKGVMGFVERLYSDDVPLKQLKKKFMAGRTFTCRVSAAYQIFHGVPH